MYEVINPLEFREVGTETLVYDPSREKVHVVNHTAAELLRQCAGKTASDLADYLRASFETDGYDVQNDVVEIMNLFAEQGLIREVAVA